MLKKTKENLNGKRPSQKGEIRPMRADAQRKMSALLQSAAEVFAESGVDAPVREIAERAGVGLGTVYRHFPHRSDLIVAVFQTQVDACADAAAAIAKKYDPGDALARCMQRFVDFIATKRGLAQALYSGDPAYSALPAYFDKHLRPVLENLLATAIAAGEVRPDVHAGDLFRAVSTLCQGTNSDGIAYAKRMVALIVDGLRYGAETSSTKLCKVDQRLPSGRKS